MSSRVFPNFSSISFSVSGFMWRSLIHLELSLVQGDKNGSICILLHADLQLNQHHMLEMNPHTYGHLIFDKGAKNIQWKKDSLFNKWCWFNWRSACRRKRIDPFLSPCTKLHSKWIKDLHVKPDTLKLIEKKLGKTLEDMGTGGKFLNRSAIAYDLRSRIDKWDLIKLQSFCKAKDTVKRTKWQPSNWERIHQPYIW